MFADHQGFGRKEQVFGFLDRLIAELELTPTQAAVARQRYEGVGRWLAESALPLLSELAIYVQGSTALGTTVRPLGQNEFDVDLVSARRRFVEVEPAALKKAIGDRLRENGHYRPLLEEKDRCWRLNYAGEFHMDITPSVPNPVCANGGELVPDRAMRRWKPSNPKGYQALFERRALLMPRLTLQKRATRDSQMANSVEPYPIHEGPKAPLRRIVQIAKRHRDIHFSRIDPCLAPISVILTTLISQSYELCVGTAYETELDLVAAVIAHMTDFIDERWTATGPQWFIWNETTEGENFAEKWNADPRRAEAFFAWHRQIISDIDKLTRVEGFDRVTRQIGDSFGSEAAGKTASAITDEINKARRSGAIGYGAAVGLGVGIVAPARANTFFGRPEL